jgi:hypothetical protein
MHALTSGGVVGHAERGDAVGALGVEDVEVLRVGDVAVGAAAAAGEALQDLPRHGARVAPRRAVLRQHHRAARHHGVLDLAPHCCCCGLTRERSDPIPPSPRRPGGPLARGAREGRRKRTTPRARASLPIRRRRRRCGRITACMLACSRLFFGGGPADSEPGGLGGREVESVCDEESESVSEPSERRRLIRITQRKLSGTKGIARSDLVASCVTNPFGRSRLGPSLQS